MKKFIRHILVVAAIAFTCIAHAQDFAYCDMDQLFASLPEMKEAEARSAAYVNELEKQLYVMQVEYESKSTEYKNNAATLSELVKQVKEKELESLNQHIQEFTVQAQNDFANKKAELNKPIQEKVSKAIQDIAKEKGYKYVFDSAKSTGVLLYADPADDIMPLVKAKLGITDVKPAGKKKSS